MSWVGTTTATRIEVLVRASVVSPPRGRESSAGDRGRHPLRVRETVTAVYLPTRVAVLATLIRLLGDLRPRRGSLADCL